MSENYFEDRNGRAIRVGDYVANGSVEFDRPVYSFGIRWYSHEEGDIPHVMLRDEAGIKTWLPCSILHVISPAQESASAASADFTMAGIQPAADQIRALESRLGELADRVDEVWGVKGLGAVFGRLRDLDDEVENLAKTRGYAVDVDDFADKIDARVSALENPSIGPMHITGSCPICAGAIFASGAALHTVGCERAPTPDTPEAADASLSRDHPRPMSIPEPEYPYQSQEECFGGIINTSAAIWDKDEKSGRCLVCGGVWGPLHQVSSRCSTRDGTGE